MIQFIIPLATTARILSLVLVWKDFWPVSTFPQRIILALRLLLLFITYLIFLNTWSIKFQRKLGFFMIWLNRLFCIMTMVSESGVIDYDTNSMVTLLWVLCFSGFVTPTFEEYLATALPISFIKPMSMMWSLHDHGDSAFDQKLSQHMMLLLFGICLNWNVHSDRRRAWLLSPDWCESLEADLSVLWLGPASRSAQLPQEVGAEWDLRCDCYFKPDERAALDATAREELSEIRRRLGKVLPVLSWQPTGQDLGSGHSSRVFAAITEGGGELLAIKEVRLGSRGGNARRAALDLPLRAALAFRHPNLVHYRTMEHGDDAVGGGAVVRLVMGLGGGGCLAALLRRFGALRPPLARRFVAQAAAGLGYLHRHGVVHDDLKPANCILAAAGGEIRLADYGPLGRLCAAGAGDPVQDWAR